MNGLMYVLDAVSFCQAGEIAVLMLPLVQLLSITMTLHKSFLWKGNWISNSICSKLT